MLGPVFESALFSFLNNYSAFVKNEPLEDITLSDIKDAAGITIPYTVVHEIGGE